MTASCIAAEGGSFVTEGHNEGMPPVMGVSYGCGGKAWGPGVGQKTMWFPQDTV